MKKYFLTLLFVALTIGYIFPAQAAQLMVYNYLQQPNGVLVKFKTYEDKRVNDQSYYWHTGSPNGISWGGVRTSWVQINGIYKLDFAGSGFQPIACQGIELNKSYYANVDITINDGNCLATVK